MTGYCPYLMRVWECEPNHPHTWPRCMGPQCAWWVDTPECSGCAFKVKVLLQYDQMQARFPRSFNQRTGGDATKY